jgi:hypothetical protein
MTWIVRSPHSGGSDLFCLIFFPPASKEHDARRRPNLETLERFNKGSFETSPWVIDCWFCY